MCVIMASVTGQRIPEDWLKAGWDSNDHGAGFGWREEVKKGSKGNTEKVVKWHKGLMKFEDALEVYRSIPENVPHVAHFRISSVGPKCPELTHPFLMEGDDAPLTLEGITRSAVLFHNGHYGSWKSKLEDMAMKSGGAIKIPSGFWSDTRAMAFIAHKLGPWFLQMFEEKLVYLSPDRFDIYGSGSQSWTLRDRIHLSNTSWDWRMRGGTTKSTSPQSAFHPPKQLGTGQTGSMTAVTPTAQKASSEVEADKRPFPQPEVEGVLGVNGHLIPYPRGMSKKQRKRWRKRMEAKGLIPSGPQRHKDRNRLKYQVH